MRINPFERALDYLAVFRRHLGTRIYLIFALALLAALSEGFGITLLLPLLATADVGMGATEGTPAVLTDILSALGIEGSLVGILLLIGLAFLFKGLVTFAYGAYGGYLQAQLMRELKGRMFRICSQMSYNFYVSRNTGHFVNLIGSQISSFYSCFSSYKSFLVNFIKALTYLAVALLLAWRFGLMAMTAGAVLLTSFRYLNKYVRRLSIKASSEMGTLNKYVVQSLQAFKYLVSTGRMHILGAEVTASVERASGYQARLQVWNAFTTSLSEPLSVMMIICIIIVQVTVLNQPLAPILVAILLFHRGMSSLMMVQAQWQQTMATIGAVELVEQELCKLELNQESSGTTKLGPLSVGISLRDVSFRYKPDQGPVIDSISLWVPARKTLALVGASGAGKSTTVDLITLMLKPQAGSVSIDGVSGEDVDLDSWRGQIGYVSQETVVFDDTIAVNISMMKSEETITSEVMERIRDAARQAQLADHIESLPDGYQTKVGDRGIRLSGGQRQRLFIARELFRKPNLLILDEATSALDSESERGVQRSLDALHGSMTVIVIAHRLATIRSADEVLVFANGRIVERGTYDELAMDSETRFSQMVEMQAL
jgi:subfamily B ATP-binding cassette protein MsbA